MGQVRKDILNGWKEIAGYVCRDIRTVERWEKQRGLPVRRMPGAGRATVYALMPELDEWLAQGGSEAKDDGVAGAIPHAEVDGVSQPGSQFQPDCSGTQESSGAQGMDEAWGGPGARDGAGDGERATEEMPRGYRGFAGGMGRRWVMAGTAAVAMVGCVLAWPLVLSHAKSGAGRPAYSLDDGVKSSWLPYGSRVAGVDGLYLRGIYFYEQRTPESLEHSLKDFESAIALDPGYAPAYAALANTYNLLRQYSVMPDAEAYPKARAAAERAVELDPKLPQAHASLGFIDFFWSWDTVGAEREFRTALTLDPASVLAHHWYGSMLAHEGRFAEALDQLDSAQRLQPSSAAILSTRALALGLSGHRGEAVDLLQDVLNQTPGTSSPHAILATLSKMSPRDPARYLEEMRTVGELRHCAETQQVVAAAEAAYRSGGELAMWAAILDAEGREHPDHAHKTFWMVEAEAALGRRDAALGDLRQLAERRDPEMIGAAIDPLLFPLHKDPRFGQMIAGMGLPGPVQ